MLVAQSAQELDDRAVDLPRLLHVAGVPGVLDRHQSRVGQPFEQRVGGLMTAVQLLLHFWGRPADVTVDGNPAADARLRGR